MLSYAEGSPERAALRAELARQASAPVEIALVTGVDSLAVALLRGAFEYQGQKCSAASRAYVPASLWPHLRERLLALMETIGMGDVQDFAHLMGAVIDRRAFERISGCIDAARGGAHARILAGGHTNAERGWFVEPTVIEVEDPGHALMRQEIFGPVLAVHVYADARWAAS